MNSTSRSSRLVRSAARSPALAMTGPEVERKLTPISRAMICASVVLPRPGGPANSTWSSASPRDFAASMKTLRLDFCFDWPMNSSELLRTQMGVERVFGGLAVIENGAGHAVASSFRASLISFSVG
jgi:hypothetical protein